MNRRSTAGWPTVAYVEWLSMSDPGGPVAHAVRSAVAAPASAALEVAVVQPIQAACMPTCVRVLAAAVHAAGNPRARLGPDFKVGAPVGDLLGGDVDDTLSELMADDVETATWRLMRAAERERSAPVAAVIRQACAARLRLSVHRT